MLGAQLGVSLIWCIAQCMWGHSVTTTLRASLRGRHIFYGSVVSNLSQRAEKDFLEVRGMTGTVREARAFR